MGLKTPMPTTGIDEDRKIATMRPFKIDVIE